MFFSVCGTGRLVSDINVKVLKNTELAEFTVVNDRPIKVEDDKWDRVPTFLSVKFFGKLSDSISNLVKGDMVQISGRLEQETWEKDGTKHSKFVCTANTVTIVNKKDKKPSTTQPESSQDNSSGQEQDNEVPF